MVGIAFILLHHLAYYFINLSFFFAFFSVAVFLVLLPFDPLSLKLTGRGCAPRFHGSPIDFGPFSTALPTLILSVSPPATIAPFRCADWRRHDVRENPDARESASGPSGALTPAGVPPPEPAVPDRPIHIPTAPLVGTKEATPAGGSIPMLNLRS